VLTKRGPAENLPVATPLLIAASDELSLFLKKCQEKMPAKKPTSFPRNYFIRL
jgi:hypothetical protein